MSEGQHSVATCRSTNRLTGTLFLCFYASRQLSKFGILSRVVFNQQSPSHPGSISAVAAVDERVCRLQVALGITTLMTHVPASLGSAHQAGALTLFSLVLALIHSLRRGPSSIIKSQSVLRQYSMPLATGGVLAVGAAVTLERSQAV